MDKKTEMAVSTSNAAINATCKAVCSAGKRLNELIQTGIIQCIEHASLYGDCTGAAKLIDAIPQTARRNEVINHFADFSPIRIVKDGRTSLMKASLRKPENEGYNDFNVEGVKANPWYERKSVTREPGVPYDYGQSEKDILNLADKLYNKSAAKNVIEIGENNEETRRDNVKNEDRDTLRSMSALLRAVARDPAYAAEKLGLAKDQVASLERGEKAEDTNTGNEQIAADQGEAKAA